MRLNRALRRSTSMQRVVLWGSLVVLAGTACGGGAPPPSSPASVASPTTAIPASPQRPSLASPVAAPSPAASPAPKPPAAGAGETYTVSEGDTLLAIAEKFYGDGTKWRRIFDANRDVISDPDALKIDMKLKIPPKE